MNAATASPTWGILVALLVVGAVVLFSVAVVVFLVLFARSMTKARLERRATFVPAVQPTPRRWPVRIGWGLFAVGALIVGAFWISDGGSDPFSARNRQDWSKVTLVVAGLGLVLTWVSLTRSRPGSPPAGPGYHLLVGLWMIGITIELFVATGFVATYPNGTWWNGNTNHVLGESLIGGGILLFVPLVALTTVRFLWLNRRRYAAAVSYAHPLPGENEPVLVQSAARPAIAPPPRRPNLWLAGGAILVAAVVFALWFAVTESKPMPAKAVVVGQNDWAGEDAVVDSAPQVVSADPKTLAAPIVMVLGGVFTVGLMIGGVLLIRSISRPKRKLTPQELDALIKSVPPLTREQRKAIFWSYLIVMALGVFFVLETVFSKMGPGASSIFVGVFVGMAALSMTLGIREWAFKKKPEEVSPPLAVAPLILTPDPTPAGGACPTCGNPIPAGSPQGLCPRCLIRGVMPSVNATRARSVRPVDPPPPAEVNEFFPHLEVLELIGAGGMGAVYKARQPNLDRVVALKIVQSPTGDDDPVFAERFAREARAMARLDHPNIVTIYESGEAGGLPYMLMEFVDGITLRDAMENKVLTTSEALAVIPQICDALDYAHRTGVVHRDIKPENILIDQTGRVKIADFGLAKLAEAGGLTLTHTRQAMGTPHYMAPEQWEKPNEVDHRADIYALGVVLYELLTGELPLGRFDLPSAKGKGNAKMDQVVLRALAKEPGQRYQHASDLKGALSKLGNWRDEPMPRRGFYEYRSKRKFLGLPLVHVVRGGGLTSGETVMAKGWIAVSNGVAVGGVAVGGVAVGGVAVGLASFGLLALGGIACGFLFAFGGIAISVIGLAIGGVAIGTPAIGGLAQNTLDGTRTMP